MGISSRDYLDKMKYSEKFWMVFKKSIYCEYVFSKQFLHLLLSIAWGSDSVTEGYRMVFAIIYEHASSVIIFASNAAVIKFVLRAAYNSYIF